MLLELVHDHHKETMVFLYTSYFIIISIFVMIIVKAINSDKEESNSQDTHEDKP